MWPFFLIAIEQQFGHVNVIFGLRGIYSHKEKPKKTSKSNKNFTALPV